MGIGEARGFKTAIRLALLLISMAPTLARAETNTTATRWIVDWAEQRCILSRPGATADSPGLSITSSLGDSGPQLLFQRLPADLRRQAGSNSLEIVLLPQGDRLTGLVHRTPRATGERSLRITLVDAEDFTERFARSEGVALERNGRRLTEFVYTGAARAIAALDACNDDLMASWGFDPVARRALSRLPQGNLSRIFTSDDYPVGARGAGAEGSVVVRLRVEADGRIGECVPVVSSGSEALDLRTCSIFMRRGRLEPALDSAGNPVAAEIASRITWDVR